MLKRAWIGCVVLGLSAASVWAASVFEDFRTADGVSALDQYWGDTINGSTAGILEIASGNSSGVAFDSGTGTSYNGEGVLDLHHTGTNSTAARSDIGGVGVARDPVSKKTWMSLDLMPGTVASGNLFRFYWRRNNDADIAQIYCSGGGFQVRGNGDTTAVGSATLDPSGWSRIVIEATYGGAPQDSSSLKVYMYDPAGVRSFLGSRTYAAGPLTGTSSASDVGKWSIQKDNRTDIADDVHLYADLMTTSNVEITPEPATMGLLALGGLLLSKRRRA